MVYNNRNNGLSLHQPEGTSTIRHGCMDPVRVAQYFIALENELSAKQLTLAPSFVYLEYEQNGANVRP